jgi:hypothetical protein
MLIIGSLALNKYIPGILPKDVDVIVLPSEVETSQVVMENCFGVPLEITVALPGSSDEDILNLHWGTGFASLDTLYWLKMSHRYKKDSVHFQKTRNDIFRMREVYPFLKRNPEPPWFKKREAETYTKTPKLNVSKEQFFDSEQNGVVQHYDHDWLHTAVARTINGTSIPSYTRYMKDGAQVACDRAKFEALPWLHRVFGVMEEAMVLAFERSIIPASIRGTFVDPSMAYLYALQKVCTSITGGWFREFAWENYHHAATVFPNQFKAVTNIIEREGVRLV